MAGSTVATSPQARSRQPATRPAWWLELLLIATTYGAYTLTRNTLPAQRTRAMSNALDVYRLERHLHIDVERSVNHLVADQLPHLVAVVADYTYSLSHFGVTAGVLVWLYVARAGAYRVARSVLLVTTVAGLLGFWLYPLAPPRLLPWLGFVDTVVRDGTWGSWSSTAVTEMSNQYAAMPSIHAAWSIWCAVTVVLLSRSRWVKAAAVAYPLVVFAVIVATANHWVLDALAGLAAVVVGAMTCRGARRICAARRRDLRPWW